MKYAKLIESNYIVGVHDIVMKQDRTYCNEHHDPKANVGDLVLFRSLFLTHTTLEWRIESVHGQLVNHLALILEHDEARNIVKALVITCGGPSVYLTVGRQSDGKLKTFCPCIKIIQKCEKNAGESHV